MRASLVRLSSLVAGVLLVLSCDGGPVSTKFGNGIGGGPTGTSPISPPAPGSVDTSTPFVRIDSPVTTPIQLINAGDSILVVTRIIDDRKVGTLTIRGIQYKGTAALGTLTEINRYPQITVPNGPVPFRPGLVDTTIRRYLRAATPVDTSVDSLVIEAVHKDSAGNVDTTRKTVQLVNGPKVTITAPVANDSVPRGISFTVSASADHPAGVDSIEIHVFGESTWPNPKLDTTVIAAYAAGTLSATLTAAIAVPGSAPPRGRITIHARARDFNRNQGNAPPIVIFARALSSVAPRVTQIVPVKLEYADSITVTATADGVAAIGRVILDSLGTTVLDSMRVPFSSPFTANATIRLPLNLGLIHQGRRVQIRSFATDSSGVTGWSQGPGFLAPITNVANAFRDTSLITYGLTFKLPRVGVAGDLAVDEIRGNVFVSNTAYNLLEVWNNTSKTFTASGVQVGSQPWGLFVSQFGANRDTLLVANSGSTTISKVDMAAATPVEALSKRIRTRNLVDFSVAFALNSGITTISWDGKINSFSDRPQYVAQSEGGRIFYSTRPTNAKTPGTVRWLDPSLPLPDTRQIWTYGRYNAGDAANYIMFNVDSIAVRKASVSGGLAVDTIYVCDHPYGAVGGDVCFKAISAQGIIDTAKVYGSDLEMVLALDLATLALTDTSFVAASGDRKWIAFGEGNAAKISGTLVDQSAPTARIVMVRDTLGGHRDSMFFSAAVQVDDIQENASEKMFGLAVDSVGLQMLGHGDKTFVAAVDLPFHLRLDGVYDSFDDGAGVAFHPRAKGTNTASSADRVAFTATRSGVIEVLDVAHYNNRGRFVTKGNLYGPLRVTPPLAGDPAGVILKLYGLTDVGLIVIDLRAPDIKP
jgi:hypothetical protein